MSKKSRRRNQAILAALVGGLALANRGKGEYSTTRPSGIDSKMKTTGTKTASPKVKSVEIPVSRNTGITRKGNSITGTMGSKVPYIRKQQAMFPGEDEGIIIPSESFDESMYMDSMYGTGAKKGGLITKKGAKRGFGRAYKRRK